MPLSPFQNECTECINRFSFLQKGALQPVKIKNNFSDFSVPFVWANSVPSQQQLPWSANSSIKPSMARATVDAEAVGFGTEHPWLHTIPAFNNTIEQGFFLHLGPPTPRFLFRKGHNHGVLFLFRKGHNHGVYNCNCMLLFQWYCHMHSEPTEFSIPANVTTLP